MIHLTKRDVNFNWISQCEEFFEEVKYALTHAPVLILPNFGERFEVICDASLEGIGTILLQNGKPIAFESCKLLFAKRNYITCEQELTVVMHAM